MAVLIGSARIDERGKAKGGQAGDQTGKEVSMQNWYKHSKGWVVLRAKDTKKAQKIAQAMRAACTNDNIGYDQNQNKTLWNHVAGKSYDPAKATAKVETDCARLVRVCCAYAGIMATDFYTGNMVARLMATGEFIKLTASKYCDQSDYLAVGDILVTKSRGHTVVVLSNGSKTERNVVTTYKLGDRVLRSGDGGSDVEDLQIRLKAVGYDSGHVDSEYGPMTEGAVEALQKDTGIDVDGEFGPDSYKALLALEIDTDDGVSKNNPVKADNVQISGGDAYLRVGPGIQYDKAGVARDGTRYVYANPNNWISVLVNGRVLWISGKYANLEG